MNSDSQIVFDKVVRWAGIALLSVGLTNIIKHLAVSKKKCKNNQKISAGTLRSLPSIAKF